MIRTASILLLGALTACGAAGPLDTAGPAVTASERAYLADAATMNGTGYASDGQGSFEGTTQGRAAAAAGTTFSRVSQWRALVGTTDGSPDFDPRTPNSPGQQPSGQQP